MMRLVTMMVNVHIWVMQQAAKALNAPLVVVSTETKTRLRIGKFNPTGVQCAVEEFWYVNVWGTSLILEPWGEVTPAMGEWDKSARWAPLNEKASKVFVGRG